MSLTAEIVAKAESLDAVRAGMVPLADVVKGPSYLSAPIDSTGVILDRDDQPITQSQVTGSLLVLGLMHPHNDLRLDWWERGDSWGNRRLRKLSEDLKQWLRESLGLTARPLPYHLEKGGVFLKDAAVLSGLGVIGQNNLLLHPLWGPRIRLRSMLIDADLPPTPALEGFDPCDGCERYCQKACPMTAFPSGIYSRPRCYRQMNVDVAGKVAEGQIDSSGKPAWVIKYCRQCELTCPVGM